MGAKSSLVRSGRVEEKNGDEQIGGTGRTRKVHGPVSDPRSAQSSQIDGK